MKKVHLGVIIAGAAVGLAALILTALGNPTNMGFCIACFLRDISGAVGLHSAAKVQYVRPEIIGLVLGAFIMSVASKEFKARAGSSPAIRFVLGAFVVIGALAFLGCPLRMVLRLGGGDLNALVGLIAMPLAGREPIALVKFAFLAFALHFAILIVTTLSIYHAEHAATLAGASESARTDFAHMLDSIGQPGSVAIANEVSLLRGDYPGIVADKAAHLPEWIMNGLEYTTFDTLGFMLMGMAMLKGGFLTGQWPATQYYQTARHCFTLSLPIMTGLAIWVIASGFDTVTTFAMVFTWSFPLRIPMVVGFAALIFWLVGRAEPGAWLRRVGAVGRMALSNYLGTSILMTAIFYGWGLGLFGHVSRAQTTFFVLAMWGIMLIWSGPWLAHFAYGPAEWLWRSLAARKLLPLVRKSPKLS